MNIPVRTPADIGSLIKARRKELKLGQAELAKRMGAERRWVINIERGNPKASIELVIRALEEVGIRLNASNSSELNERDNTQLWIETPDIAAVIDRAKRK